MPGSLRYRAKNAGTWGTRLRFGSARSTASVFQFDIVEMNIPTGMPLVYELDDNLQPLNRYYLGDPEKVKAAMEAVAAQGKKK